MAAKKKEENTEDVKKSSSDILKGILSSNKGSHYNFDNPFNAQISTGSMILDSCIKIRAGSTVRLCGEGAELGKTSQCFVLAGEYMKTIPKSKTIFVAAESRLSPEMMARSGHTFIENEDGEGWDYGTVFVLRSNVFEFIADTIEHLMKSMKEMGEHLCIIIDSLDGLILEADLFDKKSVRENTVVAGVPKLTKLLFRRIGLLNWASDGLILVTSQYSTNIKIDPYTKEIPRQGSASGGSNAGHQSDYTFMYLSRYGKDYILENPTAPMDRFKNKVLGLYATIEIKKSATDETGTKLRIPIKKGRIGNQIWIEKEITDLIISYELVNKAGSWLSFDQSIIDEAAKDGVEIVEKVQGATKLYSYLEENPSVLNWFKEKLAPMLS